jgi:hypothetical protein
MPVWKVTDLQIVHTPGYNGVDYQSGNQQFNNSTIQQFNKSSNQQINKSSNQQINK